jgi:PTH1 family peptidyl-tRNA hydrolase
LVALLDFLWRLLGRQTLEPLTGLDPDETRLIVGLGNPGPEYAETRHNVGFRTVDELARRFGAGWQDKTDGLGALVAVARRGEQTNLVFAKPQAYMNKSGQAVRNLAEFLKLEPEQTLIVYDDMDLPYGTLRLRERGSAGTHNGMRSVVSALKTTDVPRLRVGIGQSQPGEATDHVLSEFSPEESEAVRELIRKAADAALSWAELGAAVAMNRYNKT